MTKTSSFLLSSLLPTPLRIDFPRESYKYLGYVFEKFGGYKVDENRPGWDRSYVAMYLLQKSRDWVTKTHRKH